MHTRSLGKHKIVLDLIDLESLNLIVKSLQTEGIQDFIIRWVHQAIYDYGETVDSIQIQIKRLGDSQISSLSIPAKQGRALTWLNCDRRVCRRLSDLEWPRKYKRPFFADLVNWLELDGINGLYSMISLNVV